MDLVDIAKGLPSYLRPVAAGKQPYVIGAGLRVNAHKEGRAAARRIARARSAGAIAEDWERANKPWRVLDRAVYGKRLMREYAQDARSSEAANMAAAKVNISRGREMRDRSRSPVWRGRAG